MTAVPSGPSGVWPDRRRGVKWIAENICIHAPEVVT
jgi:hypothetical protein